MRPETKVAVETIGGIGLFALMRAVDAPLGLSVVLLVVMLSFPVGWFVGSWLAHGADTDGKGFRYLAWGNTIGWIVPAIGMLFAGMTARFERDASSQEGLYAFLGWFGITLASCHALFGALAGDPAQPIRIVPLAAVLSAAQA
jgi:hypothetical protein